MSQLQSIRNKTNPRVNSVNQLLRALLTSRLTTRQVYFLRIEFSGWNLDSGPLTVYGAALDFSGQELPGAPAGERTIVELLDYAFFDDDTTVLLVRADGEFDKHVAPTPLLT